MHDRYGLIKQATDGTKIVHSHDSGSMTFKTQTQKCKFKSCFGDPQDALGAISSQKRNQMIERANARKKPLSFFEAKKLTST